MNVPEIHRELAHAWVDGAEVEQWCEHTQSWLSGSLWPRFSASKYRLKPIPHSIDWSHVAKHINVMVGYPSGVVLLLSKLPERVQKGWEVENYAYINAENFASFKRGTVDWKDSLVLRHTESPKP